MAQLIDQISNSGLFAQSAYSAAVATNDDLGRKISETYLTAVDLSPYATETLVEETSGAITSLIPTNYYPDTNPSGFISGVDLTPYQTIEGMTAYQPVGDYATTAEVDTLSSMLSGAIDYVSANAGDEFPVSADEAVQYVQTNSAGIDETVTAFQTNSSTYMVEPNFEYNAVNEISAYNGSAIAQYGAEKQWLVHDDTIVHVANSAQYAFGCNISALQRLMGIDETVLWTNSNPTMISTGVTLTGELSEQTSAFKMIRFVCKASYDTGETISASVQNQDFYTNENGNTNVVGVYLPNRRGSQVYYDVCEIDFVGNTFTAYNGTRIQGVTSLSENKTRGPYILSAIGIGRKA